MLHFVKTVICNITKYLGFPYIKPLMFEQNRVWDITTKPLMFGHKLYFWYHKIEFEISQNRYEFGDVTNSILLCHRSMFWKQNSSRNCTFTKCVIPGIKVLWYHKIDFLISKNHRICDITSRLWYHKNEFLISQDRICDIKIIYGPWKRWPTRNRNIGK